jgi:hypothetical protein
MPRGRDPFKVVGSMEVELVGFSLVEDLLLVWVRGRRRSQERKILMKDGFTGITHDKWMRLTHRSIRC